MKDMNLHRLINAKKDVKSPNHYLIDFCNQTGLSLDWVKKQHFHNRKRPKL